MLIRATAPGGHIVAVDGSSGMLESAKRRATRICPAEVNIEFLRADFSTAVGVEKLCTAIGASDPQALLFTLGLSCLPNWRSFFSEVMGAAPDGARLCIMDVYSEKLTFGARLLNWIGAGDCRRPVWKELERQAYVFERQEFRPFKVLDVSVVVAGGTKLAGKALR